MSKKSSQPGQRIFSVLDDDRIGRLSRGTADETFDDTLSERSTADLSTGSFVGNFAARRVRRFGGAMLCFAFGIFLLRLGSWQILHGEEYRQISENNRTRTRTILPNRGVITDRYGTVLAWNTPEFRLVANRSDIPTDFTERALRFANIATELSITAESFEDAYQRATADQTVLLSDDVPYDAAMNFLAHEGDDPSITVELGSTRTYLTNAIPSLSHVLGYTGAMDTDMFDDLKDDGYRRFDTLGKQGLEASYESLLRGTPGVEITEVNAQGKTLRTLEKTDTVDGEDLVLSIDAGLTAATEAIVERRLADANVKKTAVVVSDPNTGEVLALVSYPSYDANLFARGISQTEYSALLDDPNDPLFPRATQGEYPCGSTMKPVYAAAALMEHVITPSTSFLSTGGIFLGNRLFPDWRRAGHGQTNVYHAIADSVNTFFYIIGGGTGDIGGLGIDRLMKYASMFGFGDQSGIDLPNEADGFLPSKEWKKEVKGEPWYVGDTYNASIGQGDILVTPLQMNRSTVAFANGGTLFTPHLTKDAVPVGVNIVPDDVATVVRDAMRQTVVYGSAATMLELPEAVAGKTGTAQWATGRDEHTWFTGFGPMEHPTIAITVIVEEGGANYYATPIAKDIFAWFFANRSGPPAP